MTAICAFLQFIKNPVDVKTNLKHHFPWLTTRGGQQSKSLVFCSIMACPPKT